MKNPSKAASTNNSECGCRKGSLPCDLAEQALERWGLGFFGINQHGQATVFDDRTGQSWPLDELVGRLSDRGLQAPMILRFVDVIRARTQQLNQAFQNAIQQFEYRNSYSCVYPVKVNQSPQVVDSILTHGTEFGVGLEAGSKPELMLVIAKSNPSTPILYNGFKDESSIELAIRASRLGWNVTLIIEKPNEVDLIARVAKRLAHRPKLGIRVKLASRGSGHWEHSGGLKSKFGLFVPQLLNAVEKIKRHGLLDCFQLLHFHPGSQINDVLRIKASVIEATRIYCDLKKMGAPLGTFDVGGGLAVDYTGDRSTHPSSMNYSLQEYANDIVYYIKRVCDQTQTEVPRIISESGRALVAHHAVLVVPVLGSSYRDIQSESEVEAFDQNDRSLQPLVELIGTLGEVNSGNLLESFHDAQQAMDMTLQLFANGMINLEHRAIGERLFWNVCQKIREHINQMDVVPVELESIREFFAETYVANFSVFQSLRDHWAINQLFPILPLDGGGQPATVDAVLGDITCDSDGKVNRFVGNGSDQTTLAVHPLPDDQPYHLGIFLVGAYQEAIGEQHNLLGRPHVVTIEFDEMGPQIRHIGPGDSIGNLLESNDEEWHENWHRQMQLNPALDEGDRTFFAQVLQESCYLDHAAKTGASQPMHVDSRATHHHHRSVRKESMHEEPVDSLFDT